MVQVRQLHLLLPNQIVVSREDTHHRTQDDAEATKGSGECGRLGDDLPRVEKDRDDGDEV